MPNEEEKTQLRLLNMQASLSERDERIKNILKRAILVLWSGRRLHMWLPFGGWKHTASRLRSSGYYVGSQVDFSLEMNKANGSYSNSVQMRFVEGGRLRFYLNVAEESRIKEN